jgi:hypothetical protein
MTANALTGPAIQISAAPVVRQTLALIRADAGLYLFIAVYTLMGLGFLIAIGALNQTAYAVYTKQWFALFGIVLPVLGILLDTGYLLHRFDKRRGLARQRIFSPYRMAKYLSGVALLMAMLAFQGTFTSIKNALPVWRGGFADDRVQADLDKWLHFGIDPWRWLDVVAHDDLVLSVVNWNYAVLFFSACFSGLFFVVTSPKAHAVRTRYLLCFMLVWIVVGNILAGLFMSAGPAYYGFVTGDAARFADQLRFLAHDASPNSSYTYQAYLWALHQSGQAGFGSGISAFPSVHVALATINALFIREYSRRLGMVAFAYVCLIESSSVYLGWHYAIDGYVGGLVSLAIYLLARRFMPAPARRALRAS